jgi:hypothetical protein
MGNIALVNVQTRNQTGILAAIKRHRLAALLQTSNSRLNWLQQPYAFCANR